VGDTHELRKALELLLEGHSLILLTVTELPRDTDLLLHKPGELSTGERQGSDVALPLLELLDQGLTLRAVSDQLRAHGLDLVLNRLQIALPLLDGRIRLLHAVSVTRGEQGHEGEEEAQR